MGVEVYYNEFYPITNLGSLYFYGREDLNNMYLVEELLGILIF